MSAKIKVLHIIKSLGRGGAEMLLPETLKLHDQNRFEFHYIYFLPWKNQLVESIEQAGGIVHCFSAKNNIQIILQYRRLINYIKKEKIQLIHCHLPWAGFIGRLIHRLNGIPVLYTEHNKQERYHGITFFLNRLTFNWQSKVIAVSEDVHESIVKNINPKVKIQTVLNGVNTMSFKRDAEAGKALRAKLNIPDSALVVGTIAVFRFQKRLVEWLEVAKRITDLDNNFYFIIVGDGPLKAEIISKKDELKLNEKVIMAGLQEEVKPWLSAMDIYMMTSVFEGLPIALLEAMSMECAIATTNAGGVKELIRDNQDGLTVDVSSYFSLTESVLKLKDNPTRTFFSGKARERVVDSFSLKKMVGELEELYGTSYF